MGVVGLIQLSHAQVCISNRISKQERGLACTASSRRATVGYLGMYVLYIEELEATVTSNVVGLVGRGERNPAAIGFNVICSLSLRSNSLTSVPSDSSAIGQYPCGFFGP